MSENGHNPAEEKMPIALKEHQSRDSSRPVDERADWIGQELRKVFDEALNEPVPDRLKALLHRLRTDEG